MLSHKCLVMFVLSLCVIQVTASRHILPKAITGIIYGYFSNGCTTSLPAGARIAVYNDGLVYCIDREIYGMLFTDRIERHIWTTDMKWPLESITISNDGETLALAFSKNRQRCTEVFNKDRRLDAFKDTPELPTLISGDGRRILTHHSRRSLLLDSLALLLIAACFVFLPGLTACFTGDSPLDMLDPEAPVLDVLYFLIIPSCILSVCMRHGFNVIDINDHNGLPLRVIPGNRLQELSANFDRIVTDKEELGDPNASDDPHPALGQHIGLSDDDIPLTEILVHPSQPDDGREVISSMDRRTWITVRNADDRRKVDLPIDFDTFDSLFTLD